jgi:hypothetical protein
LFTNRLLWLGASAGAVSLRGSGCRNLALWAFVNKPQPLFQLIADLLLLNFKHITAPLAAAEESRANT